jgi:hypothetical protein
MYLQVSRTAVGRPPPPSIDPSEAKRQHIAANPTGTPIGTDMFDRMRANEPARISELLVYLGVMPNAFNRRRVGPLSTQLHLKRHGEPAEYTHPNYSKPTKLHRLDCVRDACAQLGIATGRGGAQ